MAKGIFMGVSAVARKTTDAYIGVSGVARKVKEGYIGVNGVAKQFFSGGGQVITFKVVHLMTLYEYQAEEGMTWTEFLTSGYNDGSFLASGNYVKWVNPNSGSTLTLETSDGSLVKNTDVIQAYDEEDVNSAYGNY